MTQLPDFGTMFELMSMHKSNTIYRLFFVDLKSQSSLKINVFGTQVGCYMYVLLKKYISNLKTDGEMIIGNFSTDNPTRKVMEVMTEWFLYHRDATKLLDITSDSGIGLNRAEVEREPLGINLFLRIK